MTRSMTTTIAACLVLLPSVHVTAGDQGAQRQAEVDATPQQPSNALLESAYGTTLSLPSVLLQALAHPAAATELQLSDQQLEVLEKLRYVASASITMTILASEGKDPSGKTKQIVQDAERLATVGVLTERQTLRLRQILWQGMSERALLEPDVASRIGLTDQQKADLEKLNARLLPLYRGEVADPREDIPKRIAEGKEKMWKVLTKEQTTKVEELLGAKFDVRKVEKKK